jgi:nucleoid-associated protein YgaU
VHVVTKGETLSGIARQELGTSSRWKDLARWNDIADPSSLKEGMSLRIQATDATTAAPNATAPNAVPAADPQHPAPTAGEPRTHRVAKGDTLSRIAARYLGDATRWREIQRLNAISDPASLSEGATLKIPER